MQVGCTADMEFIGNRYYLRRPIRINGSVKTGISIPRLPGLPAEAFESGFSTRQIQLPRYEAIFNKVTNQLLVGRIKTKKSPQWWGVKGVLPNTCLLAL